MGAEDDTHVHVFPGLGRKLLSVPCEPGQWTPPRLQPTPQASVEAGLRFLNAKVPGWRDPQPWDQVSFGDGSRCVAGEVFERWAPPPVRRKLWRRVLLAVLRRLSRPSRHVSAFDAGWVRDCEDAEETWW